MPAIRLLLFYLFSIGWYASLAQQFPIQKLAVEDGLGHSIVYRTYQSHNGYLWFSTDNGLTRFDGVNLANFTTLQGLGTNFIFDVGEWHNKLYAAVFGSGVMVMDSGTFKPLVPAGAHQPRYPLDILAQQDELWIIDRFKYLHRFRDHQFFTVTGRDLSLPNVDTVKVFHFHQEKAANGDGIYLATQYGLYYFKDDIYQKITVPGIPSGESILSAITLDDHRLMLATRHGLIELDLRHNTTHLWLENQNFTSETSLFQDNAQNIWASTMDGTLYLCRKSAKGAQQVIKVLEGTVINQIFQDREHNIWLATYGEGAWCIRSIYVRNYAIKGCIVSDMIIDKGRENVLITTTNAGLLFFKKNDSKYLTHTTDKRLDDFFKNKKLMVATHEMPGGALLFSSYSTIYKWTDHGVDSLQAHSPVSALFFQKKKNRLWVGSRFNLAYTDSLLSRLTPVPGFERTIIRSLAEDASGNLLLGTDAGVFREQNGKFERIDTNLGSKNYYVNTLCRDPQTDKVWVGTNEGLGVIENNRLNFIDYPLTKVRCNSIAADNKGGLWIGSVNGLIYYRHDKFSLITTKDGISQSNIIKVTFHEDQGMLMLLTPNALSIIEVESFLKNSGFQIPDILIEKITTEDETRNYTATPIALASTVKDLSIVISSPIVKNRDKIVFTYRLNDDSWSEFNGRKITLNSLPYGELDITIRAHEIFKPAHSKTLTVSFYVERPFFLTWWFISLLGVALLVTIYGLVLFYSKRKNMKLVEENKRLDIEHKALRNLLNPHFLYNAINSIHAFILQNDQRKTLAYLAKFSQLVRLNLELLASDRVALDKELKNISLYLEFEKLRFADKLKYSINVDPSIVHSEIRIPSFMIQPFLENAIWHGLLPRPEGGHLLLQINRQKEALVITIDDDGVGINAALKNPKLDLEEKTSMGINIIKERIQLLNKLQRSYSLVIMDKAELNGKATGTGTIVKITVPLSR